MCGIVGFTGGKNQNLLKRMADSISYRGPDAEGFFVDDKINLGQRRLSIIDLEGGKQPMFDPSGQIAVVFNGEIYNYAQIKTDYLSDYNFVTTSDTEVIIAMYLKFGTECVKYFNGMFAFAFWDARKDLLFIARDRLGKKPLYLRELNGQIYFASEPKALIVDVLGKPKINLKALSLYLRFQFIPANISIWEGIEKLLPGHYLIWVNGKKEISRYWDLKFEGKPSDPKDFEGLIEDSVKIRLVSDVPLGIFLSGGLDSTTISYFAAKHSTQKIKTFSIGFEDESFDETKYSQLAANFLQTDHHHQFFSEKDVIDLVPKIFSLLDEPMADASILPTTLLTAFTRQHVTVALGGDGADEIFAGYPTFQAHVLADLYRYLPSFIKTNINKVITNLPVSHNNFSLDFKLKRFIRGADLQSFWRDLEWTSAFNLSEQEKLFKPEIRPGSGISDQNRFVADFLENRDLHDYKNQVLNFWQKGYLVDDIFVKMDRAAMYNSLEARSPFMDYRVVELVNNLPFDQKIRHWRTKFLLKETMKDKLPKEIVFRPKKGFGIPLAKWFAGSLKEFLLETLSKENIESVGIFDFEYINELINSHLNGQEDNRIKLWTLVVFVQWYNNFYK